MWLTIHRMAGQIRRVKKDLLGQALSIALVVISSHTLSCLLVKLVLWVHKIIRSHAFWHCFDLFSHASSYTRGMSGVNVPDISPRSSSK